MTGSPRGPRQSQASTYLQGSVLGRFPSTHVVLSQSPQIVKALWLQYRLNPRKERAPHAQSDPRRPAGPHRPDVAAPSDQTTISAPAYLLPNKTIVWSDASASRPYRFRFAHRQRSGEMMCKMVHIDTCELPHYHSFPRCLPRES